ncbi:helix-turn-helix transcriptional regulator [Streptomyces sp. HNM0574]|uniref:helix-turn-helix domain-containing protein n=1 Tax=Streptomyces sp. HNM0574 TaxID=2714954 RepID=UPI00146AB80B|nr:helix-turn-helix transcriptional regulator [Streptomyces sp. HNM0574]NLU66656.1 helix-turn-helix transcriptional regulator [Streptomyces sp. HNM0574]
MPPRRPVSGRSQTARARYAEELSDLRREKGISLRFLGDAVRADHSHLGHMEHGTSLGGPELARELDRFYGTTHLIVLWELALRDTSQFRERYRHYMGLEAQATGLQKYALSVVPGMLQTSAYARVLLRAAGPIDEDELEDQVEARAGRKEFLSRAEGPQFRAILDEAVLRRPLPDAGEWRAQLEHLLRMGELPNVTIQVVRASVGLHRLTQTDTMFLWLPDGRTVAYVETGYSGELIERTQDVDRLRFAYDQLRDLALSPRESREVISQLMEDVPCELSEST